MTNNTKVITIFFKFYKKKKTGKIRKYKKCERQALSVEQQVTMAV